MKLTWNTAIIRKVHFARQERTVGSGDSGKPKTILCGKSLGQSRVGTALFAGLPFGLVLAMGSAYVQAQTISTYAGTTTAGNSGDNGPANQAELNYPSGVGTDSSGNLYIADFSNNQVRKVTLSSGTITAFAGNGNYGYSGDGGQAVNAKFEYPYDIAVDSSGNVYISDSTGCRVRKVAPSGIITTVAGNGNYGYSGDGGSATSAELIPTGIAVDRSVSTSLRQVA
jgi:hypothetical protein